MDEIQREILAEIRGLRSVVTQALRTLSRSVEVETIVSDYIEGLGIKRHSRNHADVAFLGGTPAIRDWSVSHFERTGDLRIPRPDEVFSPGKRFDAYRAWLDGQEGIHVHFATDSNPATEGG